MSQADSNNTRTIDTSRRRFIAFAAAASAVSAGSLAVVAMPPVQDDRRLIELEEKIFEEWRAAKAFEPEIVRLAEIWQTESRRLYEEALAKEKQAGVYLSARER
jgi:hypothetical protein